MSQFTTALEKVFVHKDKPPFLRFLIYAAYLVPPIAVVALTWHDRNFAELEVHSTEITQPHNAYQRVSVSPDVWSLKPEYKTGFHKAFSRHYFKDSRNWLVYQPGTKTATLTVVLKNSATSRSILVNSVSVIAKLGKRVPFDWQALDVGTKLVIGSSDGWLDFFDRGTGPILDLEAELKAGGGLASRQPYKVPYLDVGSRLNLELYREEELYLPLNLDGDTLKEPLYRTIKTGEQTPKDAPVIECDPPGPRSSANNNATVARPADRWQDEPSPHHRVCNFVSPGRHEKVTTLARLREVTDVPDAQHSIEVKFRYKDVTQQPVSGMQTVELSPPLLLYRARDYSGTKFTELPSGDYADAPPPPEFRGSAIDLAKQIFKVSAGGPKGVGLIKSEHRLDAWEISECAFTQSIVEPRELLQDSGYISVTLNLQNPVNGRYNFDVLVNGEKLHALAIDILAPDDETFDGKNDTELFKSGRVAARSPDCPSND